MSLADFLPEARGVLARSGPVANVRQSIDCQARGLLYVHSGPRAIPWWLWSNILSADAPSVALAWAALFARSSGGRLTAVDAAVLALAVWVIYVSDRLLDGWTARNPAALRERHLFCKRHRVAMAGLVIVAAAAIFWLTTDRLPPAETSAGVKLGTVLAMYLAVIHVGRGRMAGLLPKEIVVGFLFAAGATLPLWSRSTRFPWDACLPWAFFGLLCSLNCLSIECWESHRRSGGWSAVPHPFVHWADSRINRIAASLAVAAFATCLIRDLQGFSLSDLLAVCLSSLLILLLNCCRGKLSSAAMRVLADAALLAPALTAVLLNGTGT